MEQTFTLNENNDIFLDSEGNISISRDAKAVEFACKNAAQTLLGEMIYRTDEGMPNFETVWGGIPNIPQFKASLISTLLSVSDVIEVDDPVVTIKDNILSYNVTILTAFGPGEITNV